MIERQRRAAELRTLLARIAHQRDVLDAVEARLTRAVSRAGEGDDPEAVAATALHLQHYYTAIEDVLLHVAKTLDGSRPTGTEWHKSLIEQMKLEIPEVRPALVDDILAGRLDVLRRFRHRVRHAYDQDFAWDKMAEPIRAWRSIHAKLLPRFFADMLRLIREIISALDSPAIS